MKNLLILLCFLATSLVKAQTETLETKIQEIIKDKKAQIGVAVILDSKDTITVNNKTQYPTMSVFKFHQALAVANYLNHKNLPLTTEITIKKEDLKPDTYSPLCDKYPDGNISLPVSTLLEYTLQLSDNNACDILFDYIGGPQVADTYIRSLGINHFSITATEEEMQKNLAVCYQNWTTPLEAARLLELLITREILPTAYQDFIKNTMIACETGKDRLSKPLLETDAVIGHKTGTGDRNANGQIIGTNDIGFVFLPDGYHYTIAVFIKNSEEKSRINSQIIADISEVVYQFATSSTNSQNPD